MELKKGSDFFCKKTAILFVFLTVFFCLSAQTDKEDFFVLQNILSESVCNELQKTGVVTYTLGKNENSLKLIPDTPIAKKMIPFSEENTAFSGMFVSESLHLVKKATLIANSKNENLENKVDTSIGKVSKIMRSISNMQGMQYYSHTRKEWETLYSDSYLIKGPESNERIGDMTEGSADGLELYCYQKDHSFSGCRYKINYIQHPTELAVSFTNIDPLKYSFLTAIKTGDMHISLIVTDCGDAYLVYLVVYAKCLKLSFLENRLNNSLSSRIEAIYKWFTFQF